MCVYVLLSDALKKGGCEQRLPDGSVIGVRPSLPYMF